MYVVNGEMLQVLFPLSLARNGTMHVATLLCNTHLLFLLIALTYVPSTITRLTGVIIFIKRLKMGAVLYIS